jgi:hypothetical protein
VGRQIYEGNFYYIAINQSYLPWLQYHHYEFMLDFHPLKPDDAEVWAYGRHMATLNAEDRYIKDAVEAIFTESDLGCEACYRRACPPRKRTTFEWAILTCNILVNPNLSICKS